MEDRKKIAAIIVAGMKPKGGMPAGGASEPMKAKDSGADEGEESDKETVAKEVMGALKANDVKSFAEALESFMKLCDYPEDSSSEE